MSGLLSFWAEPAADLTDKDLRDLFSDKFVQARLALPGFLNAQRYRATDDTSPRLLALYNLSSPTAATSDEYTTIAPSSIPEGKVALTRFRTLSSRIYDLIYEQHAPGYTPSDPGSFIPAPHTLFVGMDVHPSSSLEDEINKWYNEVQIPDVAKSKEWIRTRRYRLQSSVELSPNANENSTGHVHQYMTFHEFDHPDCMTDPAFIAAGKTKEAELYASKIEVVFRPYELFKIFN